MTNSVGIGVILVASLLATSVLAESTGKGLEENATTSVGTHSHPKNHPKNLAKETTAKDKNISAKGSAKESAKESAKDSTPAAGPVTTDAYPRTAADRLVDEQNKILDRAIKGICRGC